MPEPGVERGLRLQAVLHVRHDVDAALPRAGHEEDPRVPARGLRRDNFLRGLTVVPVRAIPPPTVSWKPSASD